MLVCIFFVLCAGHARAALLESPQSLACNNASGVVELRARYARVSVGGAFEVWTRIIEAGGSATAANATEEYRVGPTLVLTAGETCRILLRNAFATGSSAARERCDGKAMNSYRCGDVVNVHTHGLFVSPSGSSDNVRRRALPGDTLAMELALAPDHGPGSYFYHAHVHGATALHMAGGLAGALLVRDAATFALAPSDAVAALYGADGARGSVLVLQHWRAGALPAPGADVLPEFVIPELLALSGAAGGPGSLEPDLCVRASGGGCVREGAAVDVVTVNGRIGATLAVVAGATSLVRFVSASGTRVVELEIGDEGVSALGGPRCSMRLLARDGVFQPEPLLDLKALVLVPAQRADVALLCDAPTNASAPRALRVRSRADPARDAFLGTENRHAQDVVFYVRVDDPAPGAPAPAVSALPERVPPPPPRLANLLDEETSSAGLGLNYLALSNNPSGAESINYAPFAGFDAPDESRYSERVCHGNVYEFRLLHHPPEAASSSGHGSHVRSLREPSPDGGAAPSARRARQAAPRLGVHPYHQHVFHFQMVDGDGLDGASVRRGEWRDTVPVPTTDAGIRMRFRPSRFADDVVVHCHILSHEDRGMLGLLFVTPDCSLVQLPSPPTPALVTVVVVLMFSYMFGWVALACVFAGASGEGRGLALVKALERGIPCAGRLARLAFGLE